MILSVLWLLHPFNGQFCRWLCRNTLHSREQKGWRRENEKVGRGCMEKPQLVTIWGSENLRFFQQNACGRCPNLQSFVVSLSAKTVQRWYEVHHEDTWEAAPKAQMHHLHVGHECAFHVIYSCLWDIHKALHIIHQLVKQSQAIFVRIVVHRQCMRFPFFFYTYVNKGCEDWRNLLFCGD